MSGYKTYAVAVLLGLVAAGRYLGYLSPEVANTLTTLLTGAGLAALRAGVATGSTTRP